MAIVTPIDMKKAVSSLPFPAAETPEVGGITADPSGVNVGLDDESGGPTGAATGATVVSSSVGTTGDADGMSLLLEVTVGVGAFDTNDEPFVIVGADEVSDETLTSVGALVGRPDTVGLMDGTPGADVQLGAICKSRKAKLKAPTTFALHKTGSGSLGHLYPTLAPSEHSSQ